MKNLKYFLISILALFLAGACDENYIDSISKVEPGADETAPTVNIKFPLEGSKVKAEEPVTNVKIAFEVLDDIEVKEISVKLDNVEIVKYDEFKDYRQVSTEYDYNSLTEGVHSLTIVATDASGKSTTQTVNFEKTSPYVPIYEGEIFYMPFDGEYTEQVSNKAATVVGFPTTADGKVGKAYAGAQDSYLTFPTDSLVKTKQLSAVFWLKVNGTPNRAGILTASAEDKAPEVPGKQNNRSSGFRFFREASAALQQFKLNVGTGNKTESWNDGGKVDPALGEWVHFAFTISETESIIYINGVKTTGTQLAKLATPMDWTDVKLLVIMSGGPHFTQWDHYSDLSLMDELRFFNRALTVEEVNTIMNAENQ
ncbi:MAG TPA: LamG-like jellyroll fold domain-containing protein [Prolixibacteraceae bacterium]|nr:LamG-like jellyroll fold domain-containing protein [Prolixibacteraceae bacterium]